MTDATSTYLLYARSGREFDVATDLQDMGIAAWCGRVIQWKRVGKDRRPRPMEEPALPNYIFAEMTPTQFYAPRAVKHLSPTMTMLTHASERGYLCFRRIVEAEFEIADRKRRSAEVVVEPFDPGEALEIIGGPFADMCGKFRRVVQMAHLMHPKIEMDMNGIPVQVDWLDVKRAN